MRKFTKYPQNISASQKIVAYVTDEEDKAWGLLDAFFEKYWGEIPYNESARAILLTEFPWHYLISWDSPTDNEVGEGTGAVVLNLKDYEVYYRAWEEDGKDYEKVEKYDSLADLIENFIQPLHDGKITEGMLQEKVDDYFA